MLLEVHLGRAAGDGVELISALVSTGAQVVVLTAERRRKALAEWLEAGAAGWIQKHADLDEVDSTLSRIVAGETIIGRTEQSELLEHLRVERIHMIRARARFERLTPREALVLAALADGLTAEEIAQQHFVALTTVRSQIRAVLQKLDVRSQLAAVAIADTHRSLLPSDAFIGPRPAPVASRQPSRSLARNAVLLTPGDWPPSERSLGRALRLK